MCGRLAKLFASSISDVKNPRFWTAVLAELLGTLLLVVVGCGTCVGKEWESAPATVLHIAIVFGLAVATIVWCICHLSGGHINPAVTCAMLFARKISLVRALLFVAAQCGGAIAGSAILKLITPESEHGDLGITTVDKKLNVNVGQAFGVEFIITFILVFTVFATCDKKRTDLNGSGPLAIGIAVLLCHLFAIKYTGSSMNPARTLGPAVIGNQWEDHWIYWAAPILGGVLAGLLYDVLFAADASLTKAKYFLLPSNNERDNYELSPRDATVATKLNEDQGV